MYANIKKTNRRWCLIVGQLVFMLSSETRAQPVGHIKTGDEILRYIGGRDVVTANGYPCPRHPVIQRPAAAD